MLRLGNVLMLNRGGGSRAGPLPLGGGVGNRGSVEGGENLAQM